MAYTTKIMIMPHREIRAARAHALFGKEVICQQQMATENEILQVLHNDEYHQRYLACERKGVYELLIIAAGMMGAYTYNLRGGGFCNAQTANVVLMAMRFGLGEWRAGLYYLVPIAAYCAGAFVSELLPNPIRKQGLLRWDTYLVGIEALVLFIIGWIPLTVNHHVVQVMINFIASMQYNTFRQAEGIPMATTFCTNHVRQVGISLEKWIVNKNKKARKRLGVHLLMILGFIVGGVFLTWLCAFLQEKAIWVAMVPLVVVFCILAHADITSEHERVLDKPQGH